MFACGTRIFGGFRSSGASPCFGSRSGLVWSGLVRTATSVPAGFWILGRCWCVAEFMDMGVVKQRRLLLDVSVSVPVHFPDFAS